MLDHSLTHLSPTPASAAATTEELVERAVSLAGELVEAATHGRRRRERAVRRRFGRLLASAETTSFMVALTDAALRVPYRGRAARLLHDLVSERGVPAALAPIDRLALGAAARLAPGMPPIVMRSVEARVRAESRAVVGDADDRRLARHVTARRREGIDLNINVLGEAVLGEQEAARRLATVLDRMALPFVDYVSVKVSAIASQLNPVAFDDDVRRVAARLRVLYRAAMASKPSTFVNLDMEEFRDLELTMAAFRTVLDETEFHDLEAGIVLQAYLPDSVDALDALIDWASERRRRGGAPIKVRLVKGANLAMEQVEAELHGWTQAPYASKAEVDANYKRLLDRALRPEHASALRVGVASHNLFDVAWALVLAEARGLGDQIEIEMLEGMAEAEARAVRQRAGRLLLYAPITRRRDLPNALAYLVRRLDENTAPENYLRAAFTIEPGSPVFVEQAERFRAAVRDAEGVSTTSRRSAGPGATASNVDDAFVNEPDSDLAVPAVRAALVSALARWRDATIDDIPLVIDGIVVNGSRHGSGIDPSAPRTEGYRWAQASVDDVERAVAAARRALPMWRDRSSADRQRLLRAVAEVMAAERAETIGCMALDAGKTIAEGDPEVSEAIDFARYYGTSAVQLGNDVAGVLRGEPVGTVVIAPPWNFPYAIAAGGICAALAAGNTVIVKPAPETVLVGWHLVQQLWRAGVPRNVVQFVPCADDDAGRRLISHRDVDAVILTGSRETADLFRRWRPDMDLLAETSGKNAIVVTAAADIDLAVRDLVRSAFGHSGQKCSAASLAIVEASVYDDERFQRQLADAVTSIAVGPAWQPATTMGPLIAPPAGALARALTELDDGETWLVEPRVDAVNPHLWSPGVKLGVAPGSFFHLTECFGPVLGVMRAPDLATAIDWQNAVPFGLTGGIASLDPIEVDAWCERVEVGNAYVNRSTTGAIVGRQPFGGWKASAVGPGAKAGGPNYVAGLQRWSVIDPAAWDERAVRASMTTWWDREVGASHDPSALLAERNVFRYRPLDGVVLVVVDDPNAPAVAVATAAAARSAATLEIIDCGDRAALIARLGDSSRPVSKVRVLCPIDDGLRRVVLDAGIALDETPVVPHGRLELLRWVREQSVSVTNHRYGNVGAAPVPTL